MESSTTNLDNPPFIRPILMPDELGGWGHIGRLKALNGFISVDATRQHLFSWTGEDSKAHGKRNATIVRPLAAAAGLEPIDYLQHHSLHYLSNAIWQPGQQRLGLGQSLMLLRPNVYLCRRCVQDDLQHYGMAYWHREHQLPGNYWCFVHESPLKCVENSKALYHSPSQALRNCSKSQFSRLEDMGHANLIKRFLQIEKGFLAAHKPLDGLAVTRVLLEAAAKAGVRDWRGANHTPFSDLLHSKFSAQWLCSVLPVFREKQMGLRLETIDKGLSKGYASVTAFIVALAALYDAGSSEIDALLSEVPDLSLAGPASPQIMNVDKLRRAYVKESGRHRRVAKRLGLPRRTTINHLHRMGLPSLDRIGCVPSTSAEEPLLRLRRAIERFVEDGQSVSEACEGLGLDVSYFENLLRATAGNLYQATRLMAYENN
ncbi:TniQ family protein [Variovorax sp. J2P1-59]|uniref:TniQ family protein n=1 Tax=Variovorax flavidus TaxID=3053501 RepID=UPI002577690F|nr:TniQ family protein [Variovorax sp. J2P1-59]MDM0077033.1 TniQ family protein [Variovorax sp. J2P1-59]